MRHFSSLAVPVVGLTTGVMPGALGRALIACPGGPQGFCPGNWGASLAVAVATVAIGAEMHL